MSDTENYPATIIEAANKNLCPEVGNRLTHVRYQHFHIHEFSDVIPSLTLRVEEDRHSKDSSDTTLWYMTWAICQPMDQFSRKTGRIITDSLASQGLAFPYIVEPGDSPMRNAMRSTIYGPAANFFRRFAQVREILAYYIPEDDVELREYYELRQGIHWRSIQWRGHEQ